MMAEVDLQKIGCIWEEQWLKLGATTGCTTNVFGVVNCLCQYTLHTIYDCKNINRGDWRTIHEY